MHDPYLFAKKKKDKKSCGIGNSLHKAGWHRGNISV